MLLFTIVILNARGKTLSDKRKILKLIMNVFLKLVKGTLFYRKPCSLEFLELNIEDNRVGDLAQW